MGIQARILLALAALHNFILKFDSVERDNILAMDVEDPNPGTRADSFGTLAPGATTMLEKERLEVWRDNIAKAMWESYQQLLQERGDDSE
jgi:hypothetical protein